MPEPAPYVFCIAVALAITPGAAAGQDRWRPMAALTTDYVLRGISQTDGKPALQAGVTYDSPRGWYAGAWGSNVDTGSAYHPDERAHAELDLFVGYSQPLGRNWSVDVQLLRYLYPKDGSLLDYDYTEAVVAFGYRDWLHFSFAASDDTSMWTERGRAEDQPAFTWDVGIQRPLVRRLSVLAGVGYYDLSELYGTGYTYGNVGLFTDIGRLRVELSHYMTDSTGEDLFGSKIAGDRTVLSMVVSFK
jgi:uncharacterized protein (TIGR02001 family)